jgi:hypothetical protein
VYSSNYFTQREGARASIFDACAKSLPLKKKLQMAYKILDKSDKHHHYIVYNLMYPIIRGVFAQASIFNLIKKSKSSKEPLVPLPPMVRRNSSPPATR